MKYISGILLLFAVTVATQAQSGTTTFTGTALLYGSGPNTRTVTRSFTLRLTGVTSDADARRYITTLQNGGQDDLLNAIKGNNLGTFELNGQISRNLSAVRITDVNGKKRIRAVFDRWIGFGEIYNAYRSEDYPFSYIELFIDPRTGKGEGTFFPAAQIHFRTKGGADQVEIEDFGTFPGRLLGVTMRGRELP